ncbi:MAG: S8 family serine peptidase, partial [Sciscionella sp.]
MRRVFVAVTAALVGLVGLVPTATAVAPPQVPKYCKSDTKNYRYVVLYQPRTPQFAAELDLRLHCGTMRAYYPEIGVAVADSADAGFVKRIGANRAYSGQRDLDAQAGAGAAGAPGSTKAVTTVQSAQSDDTRRIAAPTASRDLSGQQWDMAQIGAKQANKINQGSRNVVVGVLDSGIEADHPDLAKAIDPAESAGCVGGKASTDPASWAPTNSTHGTH